MTKYIIKNSLQEVKIGDLLFLTKKTANSTKITPLIVTNKNVEILINDNIIEPVNNIIEINYNLLKEQLRILRENNKLKTRKIIRKIAVEIDKYYKDNIAEQNTWYYLDDNLKIKQFYSDTNFNYYNGNGFGLFRNKNDINFVKKEIENFNGK